ncbi:LysR family transcriptional regulator [Candidatus Bathyarchaeota archaeon]|nr:LysR family transcriptional regulator [Candidatus Bathyarchaeota archaeon]
MLLQKVDEFGTLRDAAKDLRMSYRHAWGMVRRAEEALGEPLLKFWKGGRKGGGGAQITESGRKMINEYLRLKRELSVLEHALLESSPKPRKTRRRTVQVSDLRREE